MCLPSVDRRNASPSQDVLAPGDRLKVLGIHALSIPAQMVNMQTGGNRPDETFIAHTVGVERRIIVSGADASVTLAADRPLPFPAAVFEDAVLFVKPAAKGLVSTALKFCFI